jgi:hypothetical protein
MTVQRGPGGQPQGVRLLKLYALRASSALQSCWYYQGSEISLFGFCCVVSPEATTISEWHRPVASCNEKEVFRATLQ